MAGKTQKGSGYGLQFWADFSRIEKGAEMRSRAVKDLNKTLTYWFSKDGGFLFNKSAANNLANYFRESLASQRFFSGFAPNVPWWTAYKVKYGMSDLQGIATGAALKSLRAIRSGYSEYRVGWSGSDTGKTGKEKRIAQYMEYLEFGRPGGNKTGEQPPRPWFSSAFYAWATQELPEFIKSTAGTNFYQTLRKVAGEGVAARADLEDAMEVLYPDQEDTFGPQVGRDLTFEQASGQEGFTTGRVQEVKARDDLLGKSKIIGQAKIGGEWYDVTDENIVKKGGAIKGVFEELYDMIEEFRDGLDRGE
jgi:hypothetical protein